MSNVYKKIKLFILAIVILIMLCLLFINHYNKQLYVRIDNSISDVLISDIPLIEEDVIVDSTVKVNKIKRNKLNLDDVNIKIKINNEYKNEYLVSINDRVDIEVNNINKEYELYYSLRNDELVTEYKIFDSYFLNVIETPNKFNLYIKIVVGEVSKEFNLGEFSVYDIVYEYSNDIKEEVEIGTIYNEDGTIYVNEDNTEYLYDDININQNIVIDNVEIQESDIIGISDIECNTNENVVIDSNELDNTNIELKGNVYVVEGTNLNNIDVTGYLFIETDENIIIDKNILVDSEVHSITIISNNFTINNESYYYECDGNDITINNLQNEQKDINEIINASKVEVNENNELVITKDESSSSFNLMENSKSNLLRL